MNMTNQINLKNVIDKINNWEDWKKVQIEIFHVDKWKEASIEMMEESSKRENLFFDGVVWEPFTDPYDVSSELKFIYEKIRLEVFKKLEPDAAKENEKHPEWYGKQCIFCKVVTEEYYSKKICPFCGKELLPWTLNND